MPFHRTAAIVPRETFAASALDVYEQSGRLAGTPGRAESAAASSRPSEPGGCGGFRRARTHVRPTAEHQRSVFERETLSRRNRAALQKRHALELDEREEQLGDRWRAPKSTCGSASKALAKIGPVRGDLGAFGHDTAAKPEQLEAAIRGTVLSSRSPRSSSRGMPVAIADGNRRQARARSRRRRRAHARRARRSGCREGDRSSSSGDLAPVRLKRRFASSTSAP